MQTIKIKGMSCEHCRNAVAKALAAVPGITDVKVDLAKGEASFDIKQQENLQQAKQAIHNAGYETE